MLYTCSSATGAIPEEGGGGGGGGMACTGAKAQCSCKSVIVRMDVDPHLLPDAMPGMGSDSNRTWALLLMDTWASALMSFACMFAARQCKEAKEIPALSSPQLAPGRCMTATTMCFASSTRAC